MIDDMAERSRIQDRAQVPEVGWILGYWLWRRERGLGPSVGDVCLFVLRCGLTMQPKMP